MRELQSSLRQVMSAIENLRDDLKALSDTIWANIHHNDPVSLQQGFKFKQAFNDRWIPLDEAAEALWRLLQEQCAEEEVEAEPVKPKSEARSKTKAGKERLPEVKVAGAQEAGEGEPQVPEEPMAEAEPEVESDFKGKTPFGLILGGRTFTSPSDWGLFYQVFLQELCKQDPEAFDRLPERKAWRDARGKPLFGRAGEVLRRPLEVTDRLFAEADLPLNLMLQSMRKLARELQVPPDSLKILLKENRRGTVETKPLAA
jgi:hypothetical protein